MGQLALILERPVHLAGEASPDDPPNRGQELSRKITDAGLLSSAG